MTTSSSRKQKKTIMIVDDNHSILDIMTLMLKGAGYAVRVTTDGRDVLNLKKPLPDLLFLDLLLSGTNGSELCTQLKSDNKTKNLPIIIFSANINIKKIAKTCGADGFLTKPFEMNELLKMARKHTSV